MATDNSPARKLPLTFNNPIEWSEQIKAALSDGDLPRLKELMSVFGHEGNAYHIPVLRYLTKDTTAEAWIIKLAKDTKPIGYHPTKEKGNVECREFLEELASKGEIKSISHKEAQDILNAQNGIEPEKILQAADEPTPDGSFRDRATAKPESAPRPSPSGA